MTESSRWASLSSGASACGSFFAVITPRLVALSPAWQHYDRVQEENGLDSGALYYTNVPVVQSAEEAMKHAVKAGMAERRELAIAQRRNAEL